MFILGFLEENGIENVFTILSMHMLLHMIVVHCLYSYHLFNALNVENFYLKYFPFVWDTSGVNNLKRDYTKCLKISAAYIVQNKTKIP